MTLGKLAHTNVGIKINVSAKSNKQGQWDCPLERDCNYNSRIVNGCQVKENTFPWQVMVLPSRCGGTILCPKFAMTAAHCHIDCCSRHAGEFSCKLGICSPNDICELSPATYVEVEKHWYDTDGRKIRVKQTILHDNYDTRDCQGELIPLSDADFALLELEEPINFNPKAMALHLPLPGDTVFQKNTAFALSGWGTMKGWTRCYPEGLNAAKLNYLTDKDCEKKWADPAEPGRPTDKEICAFAQEKSGCSGDSGGPLAWLDPKADEVKLIGVVSWGSGSCTDYPSVFAKITSVLNWIESKTGKCNKVTCNEGNCMTKTELHKGTLEKFFTHGNNEPDCQEEDERCSGSQSCCDDLECDNGRCKKIQEQVCQQEGESCYWFDEQCCKELECDGWMCKKSQQEVCKQEFESCDWLIGLECCDGLECDDGMCKKMQEPVCKQEAETCNWYDDQCCKELECDIWFGLCKKTQHFKN